MRSSSMGDLIRMTKSPRPATSRVIATAVGFPVPSWLGHHEPTVNDSMFGPIRGRGAASGGGILYGRFGLKCPANCASG
jgi:hypothetical protein